MALLVSGLTFFWLRPSHQQDFGSRTRNPPPAPEGKPDRIFRSNGGEPQLLWISRRLRQAATVFDLAAFAVPSRPLCLSWRRRFPVRRASLCRGYCAAVALRRPYSRMTDAEPAISGDMRPTASEPPSQGRRSVAPGRTGFPTLPVFAEETKPIPTGFVSRTDIRIVLRVLVLL